MPDNDFESWFDSWAEGVQRAACADAARPDFDWAIGGEDPDEGGHVAAEYAIEPVRGGCARLITDHLPCAIEDLPDFRDEARILTRTVTYGPWRYVTPEEIRNA